ncbi:MAG TPA: hypothetical protein VJ954_04080 [Ignavibacteriaceae bacterium]|nr:hypothetical protein [Ignavibacteriaceae bacterium]
MCRIESQFKNYQASHLLHQLVLFEFLSSTVTLFPVEEIVNL